MDDQSQRRRRERLAAALRENLRRRKHQDRARRPDAALPAEGRREAAAGPLCRSEQPE